jgi:hypothetical protein
MSHRHASLLDSARAARLLELVLRSLVIAAPSLVDDALTPAMDAGLRVLLDAWLRPAPDPL